MRIGAHVLFGFQRAQQPVQGGLGEPRALVQLLQRPAHALVHHAQNLQGTLYGANFGTHGVVPFSAKAQARAERSTAAVRDGTSAHAVETVKYTAIILSSVNPANHLAIAGLPVAKIAPQTFFALLP
ncbi:hypothetical protein SDC9_92689 [bioreactor metagenome]|uniref:Uncharacterized protein n=1 Tax=bioreactor metagenome TaxID=1076179 RepID=A0A644ZYH2_9ZZZZ